MEVLEFNIMITHNGSKHKLVCHKIHVFKVPHIRVYWGGAFIFYEIKEKGKRFFRFGSNNKETNDEAASIEIALNKSIKAKAKVQPSPTSSSTAGL